MEKLHVSIIIEILGRPPEHLREALNTLIIKIGSEKGVKILSKIYHEPQPAKDSKTLYTAFAEVELEIETIQTFLGILFAYMPSHVEIISPERITFSNADLSDLASSLTQRLHEYDALAKTLVIEREELAKKLYELAPELFKKPEQTTQQNKQPEPKKTKSSKKTKKS